MVGWMCVWLTPGNSVQESLEFVANGLISALKEQFQENGRFLDFWSNLLSFSLKVSHQNMKLFRSPWIRTKNVKQWWCNRVLQHNTNTYVRVFINKLDAKTFWIRTRARIQYGTFSWPEEWRRLFIFSRYFSSRHLSDRGGGGLGEIIYLSSILHL